MTLVHVIGIDAAQVAIAGAGGRNALIGARYDRALRRDGAIHRLLQENVAQTRAIPPEPKYGRGALPGTG